MQHALDAGNIHGPMKSGMLSWASSGSVFKWVLARLSLMVGVALKQTQIHNWRHLDRSVLHPFFATFLAPKISIPNCLPSNIPVLPLLSQCPMCTLPRCLPSTKPSKLTMGIYQQLLIRLKGRLTHLHLTGSPPSLMHSIVRMTDLQSSTFQPPAFKLIATCCASFVSPFGFFL